MSHTGAVTLLLQFWPRTLCISPLQTRVMHPWHPYFYQIPSMSQCARVQNERYNHPVFTLFIDPNFCRDTVWVPGWLAGRQTQLPGGENGKLSHNSGWGQVQVHHVGESCWGRGDQNISLNQRRRIVQWAFFYSGRTCFSCLCRFVSLSPGLPLSFIIAVNPESSRKFPSWLREGKVWNSLDENIQLDMSKVRSDFIHLIL